MDGIKRTWAEINLDNAAHNLQEIRRHTGGKVMAVIKADGYGHGARQLARVYERLGVDYFAVACLAEAVELRKAGVMERILILGPTPAENLPLVLDYGLTQTVYSVEYALQASHMAQQAGKTLMIHMKADTGMGRIGFHAGPGEIHEAAEEILQAARLPGLYAEGIYMHFADAENPDLSFTERQFDAFSALCEKLAESGLHFSICHCANSAAVIHYKKAHLDYVRPGLILYGLYPGGRRSPELDLKPVMTLKSAIAEIRTIRAGETVSYGRIFTAERDLRVAVIPAGYADGLTRSLSNFAEFSVGGQRARILGRICMDMCMIDITGIENVAVGDPVILFGGEGSGAAPVEEWAAHIGTISYEICCLITKRVPRAYLSEACGGYAGKIPSATD